MYRGSLGRDVWGVDADVLFVFVVLEPGADLLREVGLDPVSEAPLPSLLSTGGTDVLALEGPARAGLRVNLGVFMPPVVEETVSREARGYS